MMILLLGVSTVDGKGSIYACPVKKNGRHDEKDDVAQNQNGNWAIQVDQESFFLCDIERKREMHRLRAVKQRKE